MQLYVEDKIKAAYHLALLEEPYSRSVSWHTCSGADGQTDGAIAFYRINHPPILFALGHADDVASCLATAEDEPCIYGAWFDNHHEVISEKYMFCEPMQMQRMVLTRDRWHKLNGGNLLREGGILTLTPRHRQMLYDLYACNPDFRPDPHQYKQGNYVGMFKDGKLVSAAGTHFLSSKHSFAMIGNVLTHPVHRRKGYAREVVSVLLDILFDKVELVCLNVNTQNPGGVKLYESMGFTTHCTYHEGLGFLKAAAVSAV